MQVVHKQFLSILLLHGFKLKMPATQEAGTNGTKRQLKSKAGHFEMFKMFAFTVAHQPHGSNKKVTACSSKCKHSMTLSMQNLC